MLTIVEYMAKEHTLYARMVNADAASGELVIPGRATDSEIRDRANETLCAPEIGDFSDASVVWEN